MIIQSRQQEDGGSMLLVMDNGTSYRMTMEEYFSLRVYEMNEITCQELSVLDAAICTRRARKQAVSFVAAKLRCSGEVREKLLKEGFAAEIADAVIAVLTNEGYIDDEKYIRKYAKKLMENKKRSAALVARELHAKGLDGELVQAVLAEFSIDEQGVAIELLQRKFGMQNIQEYKMQQKMKMFLRYRGYDSDVIERAVVQFVAEKQRDEEEESTLL